LKIAGGYIDDAGGGTHPQLPHVQMFREGGGYWFTKVGDPALTAFSDFDHKPYMIRLVKPDEKVSYRTDLYSRCQVGFGANNPGGAPYQGLIAALDGSVSCSVVVDPDMITSKFEEIIDGQRVWPETFKTTEEFWHDEFNSDRPLPSSIEELVIYELHVGALGFGKPGPGTLKDAIDLLDYLVTMGVNAVELLPMSEFGFGDVNWGYSTSHYFAVEFSGGGRDQYKYFVKECHRRGISVIMDVVYNHYAHARERAQGNYDSNSPEEDCYYWHHRVWDQSVPNDWRGYIDNGSTGDAPRYWEEAVRNLFISSALTLIEEFHIDGFRVDLLNAIHRDNYLKRDTTVVGKANVAGLKFLREWTRALKLINPNIFLMAEDHSEWPAVLESPDSSRFGMGFDYTWFSQFYHRLIGEKEGYQGRLLSNMAAGDDRELDLDAFAWALEQSQHRHVVYHESHDEAGNADPGKPSISHRTIYTAVAGAPLIGPTRDFAEARCRLVAGMTFFSAGTPMFLFGEEVGASRDFNHHSILENREDLNELRRGWGANLFRFYCDAIQFRRLHRGFSGHLLKIVYVHRVNRVLAFRRLGPDQEFLIVASFHNRPYERGYSLTSDVLADGSWREVFNSDSQRYGGQNVGNQGAVLQTASGQLTACLPANGFVIFRRV
jgi:1,4-alpha-glucan branching enzyme